MALRQDAERVCCACLTSAIADVAAAIEPGPWIAHVSGATSLRRTRAVPRQFGLHPLQTFTRARGAEQLDGAWAGEARLAAALAEGRLADARPAAVRARATPRAATSAARSSPRTTWSRWSARHRVSSNTAGAPPEALVPLMRGRSRTASSRPARSRAATGRGERHVRAIHEAAPGARADVRSARRRDARVRIVRTAAERRSPASRRRARSGSCRRWARSTRATCRFFESARAENAIRRRERSS